MSFGGLSFLGSGALAEGCPYPHLAQPLMSLDDAQKPTRRFLHP